MGWLKRKRTAGGAAVQLRDGGRHPFGVLDGYVPLRNGEIALYRSIREAVPIVDAAVLKLIRLTGGAAALCGDRRAQEGLDRFLRTVDTGRGQRGVQSFLDCYLDSLLTCGRAVGEMVLRRDGRGIAALLCGDVADIEVKEGNSPLEFALCARRENGAVEELPRQDLLLFTPFQPECGSPYGVSLLRSMPFLTGILLKIYQAVGMNWERMGNVRFAVVYRPGSDGLERAYAQERSEQIAREWSAAMQAGKSGGVRDFVAVGDVEIKVIGADSQFIDTQVPVRQILEQMVAKTGLPPFLLGLSWSTTERMSRQQADLLTSELESYRNLLTPVIQKICGMVLELAGMGGEARVVWDNISLQDETELAQARLMNAQAAKLEKEGVN